MIRNANAASMPVDIDKKIIVIVVFIQVTPLILHQIKKKAIARITW